MNNYYIFYYVIILVLIQFTLVLFAVWKLVTFVEQVRDESKKHDPCLVEFSKLPEQERTQNIQLAQDTLRFAQLSYYF